LLTFIIGDVCFFAPLCLGVINRASHSGRQSRKDNSKSRHFPIGISLLILALAASVLAQNQTKRNGRPQGQASPQANQEQRGENDRPADPTKYAYEFSQPKFVVSHVVIEHDTLGHGKITFEKQGEETPIVEPVELSATALGRVRGLWSDLRFLDSSENYQANKQFPHLGTYRVTMDDGKRKRTAEFNWSDNKQAWALITEYRRLADQLIFVFDMKLAREMQPLNTPQLMNYLDSLLSRGELSDPQQLVPLLTELRSDEHIPLIARNHADRLLKKIGK
jgi:hypothetical protein